MTKKLFQWAVAAAIAVALPMCVTSCTDKYDNPVEGDGEIEYLNPQQEASIAPCNVSATFISDMSSGKYGRVVNAMFPQRASIDEADIAVVTSAEIGTFDGKLFGVYERGGTIVIIKPDGRHYEEFAEYYGLEKKMSEVEFGEILAFAFNKAHRYYTLYDDTDEESHDEQYYVRKLNSLSEWLTELHQPAPTRSMYAANAVQTRSDGDQTFSIDTPDEIATYNIPVHMVYEIMKQASSYGDGHERWGSIDVKLSVWYAYGNSGNETINQGDYYFVKCDVTAHNADVWLPYKKKHGGVFSYIIGYFMRQMQVCATLQNPDQENECLNNFYSDPKPHTSEGSTTYVHTDGWSVGGGITASGGYSQGGEKAGWHGELALSFSFNHSWSYSEQKTVKDVFTQNNSNNGQVDMNYIFGNLNQTGEKHFDKIEQYYSDVCRSNAVLTSSWAWKVPIGKWGVQDNSNKSFRIHLKFFPKYGTDHWKGVSSSKFHRDTWTNQSTYQNSGYSEFDFNLSSPNRTPYGILAIKNGAATTQSTVLSDIKIWENDADTSITNPYTISSTYSPGEKATITLEAGKKYKIKYKLIDTSKQNDSGDYVSLGNYMYKDVEIKTGKDETSATTEISTADGKAQIINTSRRATR